MADTDPARVLLVAATDSIDREIIVEVARRSSVGQARVIATAEEPGRLATARDQLDGILNLLVEFEIPATGTIADKGVDPLNAADAELVTYPADEVIVLVDASDDIAAWEFKVADHGILRHGAPVVVRPGTAEDLTAA